MARRHDAMSWAVQYASEELGRTPGRSAPRCTAPTGGSSWRTSGPARAEPSSSTTTAGRWSPTARRRDRSAPTFSIEGVGEPGFFVTPLVRSPYRSSLETPRPNLGPGRSRPIAHAPPAAPPESTPPRG